MAQTVRLMMLSIAICGLGRSAWADNFGSGPDQFTIDFVNVDHAGNLADELATPVPLGAVAYDYRMAKYEVSRAMVQSANQVGGLAISLDPLTQLQRAPVSTHPATGISWNEAARFVNWLNTSQGHSPAYKFARQPGDVGYFANENAELWQAGDLGFDSANPYRNTRAHYFLPSADEWHKATFFDPAANGGVGRFWMHATGSNTAPRMTQGGTEKGTAVYGWPYEVGPATVTQAGGLNPWGIMGLQGNANEMTETSFDGINDSVSEDRVARGFCWDFNCGLASAMNNKSWLAPTIESSLIGFRVASVPEPLSVSWILPAIAGWAARKRVRRLH